MWRGSTPLVTASFRKAVRGALISAQSSQSKGMLPQLRNFPHRNAPMAHSASSHSQPSQRCCFSALGSNAAASRFLKYDRMRLSVFMGSLLDRTV